MTTERGLGVEKRRRRGMGGRGKDWFEEGLRASGDVGEARVGPSGVIRKCRRVWEGVLRDMTSRGTVCMRFYGSR